MNRKNGRSLGFAGVGVLAGALLAASALAQEPVAIIAGRYLAPDGTLKPDAAIVISNGKIKTILSTQNLVTRYDTVRYPEAVVCPGLIDIGASLGAHRQNMENVNAIDPAASAADLLDPNHRDFPMALRAGITTVMISPATNNLVSGTAAVVKTARSAAGQRQTIRVAGPLVFALGSSVWRRDRAPTSRLGSVTMLRDALKQAKQGTSQGKGWILLETFANGALDGYVACDEAMDVDAALLLFADYGRSVAIAHTGDDHNLSIALAEQKRTIVIGPYSFSTPPRTLSAAASFAAAGVPVAFAGRLPSRPADALRITAALAVKYGMNPARARQAITSVPAKVAGVADRVGAIRPGLDADLVVFSDDPLRLDARVLAVYVNGRRVYSASPQASGTEPGSKGPRS